MKREINLSPEQVKAILGEAKKNSLRDYLLLKTLTIGDFRVGEVVGSAPRFWVPYCQHCGWHWFTKHGQCEKCMWSGHAGFWMNGDPNLPGLQIKDLRDNGVWVQGKGWKKVKDPAPPKLVPLSIQLIRELREFVGKREKGRIFEISESRVEQMTRFYAKRAGVIDWKLVHPHRFRHFTTTQVGEKYGVLAARDIARHKNVSTTNRYLAEINPERKRQILQEQADLISV